MQTHDVSAARTALAGAGFFLAAIIYTRMHTHPA